MLEEEDSGCVSALFLEFSNNNGAFITGTAIRKSQEQEEGETEEEEEVAVLATCPPQEEVADTSTSPTADMLAPTHEAHAVKEAVGDVLVEEETSWEHAAALVGDDDLRRIYAAALGYAALVRPLS